MLLDALLQDGVPLGKEHSRAGEIAAPGNAGQLPVFQEPPETKLIKSFCGDDEFYKKLLDTVEIHLSDPDFNVEALSRLLQMSRVTLYRKIHALTGKSPTSFISSYRIKRAAQLLEAHAGNISEVAGKVGFLDKSYFARCFKEQFHSLPSDVLQNRVRSKVDLEFIKALEAVMKKNVSDSEFNVGQLAKKLYMNRGTVYRKILAITGERPAEYIRSHRLRWAAQLLESNFGGVTEVALEVGFSNPAYFARCFKEMFQQSPSRYRASRENEE